MGEIFWSEKFWFAVNSSWQDMENRDEGPYEGVRHPQVRELMWALPVALVLLFLRHAAERFLFKPIGNNCGLKDQKVIYPERNEVLSRFYKEHRRPDYRQIAGLAGQLDWTPRRIERWFRIKRNQQKSSVLQKFCESGWRFCFYSVAFVYGVYVVHDEAFTYDTSLISDMSTWPHHAIKDEYLNYYVVEIAVYLSLLVSLMKDARRSDFYVHCLHHFLTLGLLSMSWASNFTRLGMLVLVVHDVADAWLEIAKLFQYAKYTKTSDFFFTIFFLVWIVSRVFVLPIWLIYPCWSSYFNWYRQFGHIYAPFVQMSFLTCLYCLHLVWTYFIVKHVVVLLRRTEGEHADERSASEASEISSGEPGDGSDFNSNAKLAGKKDD